MEPQYEKALADGCRAGEESARKELYTRFAQRMLAVCYRYTGDMDAAHDVLHDGFVKIFTRFTYRGEAPLEAWVQKVMVSKAIDYLRRKQRNNQWVVNEELLPDVVDEATEVDYAGQLPQEVLMQMVAELPEGCRTVFNLYVFEHKSHQEIAQLLGIKKDSSASQLSRAKNLLAQMIRQYTNTQQ